MTIKSIVAAAMCAVLGVSGAGNARAAEVKEEVKYLDWDAEQGKFVEKSTTDYNEYTGGSTLNYTKPFVLKSDVTVNKAITVSGKADKPTRLILCDGKTLTVSNGVKVAKGKALIICGQKEGSGVLQAVGGYNCAGIGGDASPRTSDAASCGDVTINGGTVDATGNGVGAGIGGGNNGAGGNVTINGGTVIATGSGGAPGIGSRRESAGTVTFGANFVGGVNVAAPWQLVNFKTTTQYVKNSYFNEQLHAMMPVVPVGENTYAKIVGGSYSITGKGSVTNFPKALNRESITSAEIEGGITEIGARFFKDCTNLKTMTIGKDVKTIGEKAFYKCFSLEEINVASADILDALTGAVNYRMMYDADGKFVMAPKINIAGYVEMLYGKKNLAQAEWDSIGKLSEQNLEELKAADEYHFFQTRLVAEQ